MANPVKLPPSVVAQIEEVAAQIPLQHREMPTDGEIYSSIDSAILHLNDWAFLNSYGYVNVSGSAKERRWRFSCVFHSRAPGKPTKDGRKIPEDERKRVNTRTRGISCPVGVNITQ